MAECQVKESHVVAVKSMGSPDYFLCCKVVYLGGDYAAKQNEMRKGEQPGITTEE